MPIVRSNAIAAEAIDAAEREPGVRYGSAPAGASQTDSNSMTSARVS